jgi:putative hydrolase of the HAD superfamily
MILKVDKRTVIVFDLDDTLVYEIDYLKSAFFEISQTVAPTNSKFLFRHLFALYRKNENPFQYLVRTYNVEIDTLLTMYRNHTPKHLELVQNVLPLLQKIKEKEGKIAIITDGRSITQRNKIKAIGIFEMVDEIIISEEIGTEKPSQENFKCIENAFKNCSYCYIGDNTKKDFISPNKMGWNTIQILDAGKNIHTNINTFEINSDYLPKHMLFNFSEIKII